METANIEWSMMQGVEDLQRRIAGLNADQVEEIEDAYYAWLSEARHQVDEQLPVMGTRRAKRMQLGLYQIHECEPPTRKSPKIRAQMVSYSELARDLRCRELTKAYLSASTGDTFAFTQAEFNGLLPDEDDPEDAYY